MGMLFPGLRCSSVLAWLFLSLVAWLGMPAYAKETAARPGAYQLGVFPHLAAGQIENMFAPIAQDFSKALDRPVVLKTKPSFEDFMRELDNQTYDIAFVQPFDYVWVHDRHGYVPLARRGEPLAGLIVVKPESPLRSLAQLKGRKIGMPPEVAAVSHLAKMALLQAGIDPRKDVKVLYYKAHDSCLQQLLIGEIDACSTGAYPLRFFENKWNVNFRILAETQSISHSLFIVHPRVSAKDREIIKKTILSWDKTQAGRLLLERGELKPFVAVTDEEYGEVRKYTRQMQGQ